MAESADLTLIPQLREAMSRFLGEENFHGRDLMAAILAGVQGTAALPDLLRACARDLGDDQDSLQTEVIELLHADPAACRPVVFEFATAEAPALRRVGLWAFGFVIEAADIEVLATAATDPDPGIRSIAVGSVPDPAHDGWAFRVLTQALHDPDEQVRVSAVSRLSSTGRSDAVAPVAALAADSAPRVRAMAAYALGRLNNTAATPAQLPLLNDPKRHVRERTVEALGSIGGPAAVDALLALATAADPRSRVQTAKTLPKAVDTDPRVTAQITKLARDAEPAVRVAILSGLASTPGGSTWAPLVVKLANDPDPLVRQRVAVVVRHLAPNDAPRILRRYEGDEDPSLRRLASTEIGRLTNTSGR